MLPTPPPAVPEPPAATEAILFVALTSEGLSGRLWPVDGGPGRPFTGRLGLLSVLQALEAAGAPAPPLEESSPCD